MIHFNEVKLSIFETSYYFFSISINLDSIYWKKLPITEFFILDFFITFEKLYTVK